MSRSGTAKRAPRRARRRPRRARRSFASGDALEADTDRRFVGHFRSRENDPARREEGFLLPIGGAKGYGLALAIGLLAGVLNGAACGREVVDFTKDTASPTNTGQFVAAISVAAFADPDRFGRTVDMVFDQMRAAAPLPGHDPVRIPGERREAARKARLEAGVPLHRNLWNELATIAGELGIEALPPLSGER